MYVESRSGERETRRGGAHTHISDIRHRAARALARPVSVCPKPRALSKIQCYILRPVRSAHRLGSLSTASRARQPRAKSSGDRRRRHAPRRLATAPSASRRRAGRLPLTARRRLRSSASPASPPPPSSPSAAPGGASATEKPRRLRRRLDEHAAAAGRRQRAALAESRPAVDRRRKGGRRGGSDGQTEAAELLGAGPVGRKEEKWRGLREEALTSSARWPGSSFMTTGERIGES